MELLSWGVIAVLALACLGVAVVVVGAVFGFALVPFAVAFTVLGNIADSIRVARWRSRKSDPASSEDP